VTATPASTAVAGATASAAGLAATAASADVAGAAASAAGLATTPASTTVGASARPGPARRGEAGGGAFPILALA
jgi:hypothetical protein